MSPKFFSLICKTVLLVFLCTLTLSAMAQEITGQIRGTVTDPTDAVVPNATITVTNVETKQVVRQVTTNAAGQWVAPLLPVGRYNVTCEAPGFKKFQRNDNVLNLGGRLTVDVQLQLGSAGEVVSVEAEPVHLNMENAAVEGLITGVQVRELPLNNRNYEQLVTLQPGVVSNAADQIYVGTTNPSGQVNIVSFAINGNRQSQNNWTVDGADNVDHGSNITLLVYPSVDSISEFKIERSNYNPEFGRSASGQINVVTRGGTADLHGSLYEFFRNEDLNANSYLNKRSQLSRGLPNRPPVLRYNDFGGTLGGPLYIPGVYNRKRDQTFFFFSEELRRVRTPVTQTTDVPLPSWLTGNFGTETVCTTIDATGTCTAVGTSIPTANISAGASAYVKDVFSKVPVPTSGNSLRSVIPGVFNYQEELVRLDHVVNAKFALMGRFVNDHIPTEEPFGLFGPQSSLPGVANTKTNSPGRQWMGRATMQFTPRAFNEVGYAYSYGAIISDPTGSLAAGNSPDVVSAISLPFPVTLGRIPSLGFANLGGLFGFGTYLDYNRNHNGFDNFSYSFGRHALKFGFSFNHYQKKENAAGNNSAEFDFDDTCNGALCAGITSNGEAREFANFLLGYVSAGFSQSSNDLTADVRQNLWEFYGQDEWRVRSNLTISYGVRYSYLPTPYGGIKNLTTFDPSQYVAADAPQIDAAGNIVPNTGKAFNGMITGGVNSPYGQYITEQPKANVAPRLGLAWDPRKNGKTSIRAGFGLFYDAVAAGLIEDNVFNNPPFLGDTAFGGVIFFNTAANAAASVGQLPPSVWTTNPKWKTPYVQEWNFDLQQDFGHGFIFDLGYVGNKGTRLPGVRDINQVAPGVAVAAGLAPAGAKNSGGNAFAEKLNFARPYVGYMQIGQITPSFNSTYHALQTSLVQHLTGTSQATFNYTWSHALTDNQTDRSSGTFYTYCTRCDYGRSSLDRRHVFTGNFVQELPWYRNQEGFLGRLFGGVSFSGILTVNSGLPITIFTSRPAFGDPLASGYAAPGPPNNGRVATPRPLQVSDPNTGAPHTFAQWINPAAFVNPSTGGSIAGLERRGAVNGPGLWRVDLAFLKNTKITERVGFQFRAEAFNLFNHTNPSTIGTTLTTTSTFNTVTNTRDPRILQLALRLSF